MLIFTKSANYVRILLNFAKFWPTFFGIFRKCSIFEFSENCWKKRLAKTVFPGEKGKWSENGRNGEKGKRNRLPGKGRRQSSKFELRAQVQGVDGSLCAPKCTQSQCPKDKPQGTLAFAQCMLQDQSGDKYCALACFCCVLTWTSFYFFSGLSNFRELVLCCIDASDSESRRIVQHFWGSTKFNKIYKA